jgi:hypothetical protein
MTPDRRQRLDPIENLLSIAPSSPREVLVYLIDAPHERLSKSGREAKEARSDAERIAIDICIKIG